MRRRVGPGMQLFAFNRSSAYFALVVHLYLFGLLVISALPAHGRTTAKARKGPLAVPV